MAAQQAACPDASRSSSAADVDAFNGLLQTWWSEGHQSCSEMKGAKHEDDCDIMNETRLAYEKVSSTCPNYPSELKRLMVGALASFRFRLVDITIREHVHLLYIIEGKERLRAHQGMCYVYKDGAFTPFTGVPTQSMLGRVKRFFLELEGMFRAMSPSIERTPDALINAITDLVNACGGTDACRSRWQDVAIAHSGAPQRRQRQDQQQAQDGDAGADADDRDERHPWTKTVAWALSRSSASLQREILNRNVIPYYVEWCETEMKAQKGVVRSLARSEVNWPTRM